jgi:hypothetical protein
MTNAYVRLSDFGYRVGLHYVELLVWRDKHPKKDLRLLQALQFIHTNLWTALFNKKADALERSTENEDECIAPANY